MREGLIAFLAVLPVIAASTEDVLNETQLVHSSGLNSSEYWGPADAYCPRAERCTLQVKYVDQQNQNCSCYVSPLEAGETQPGKHRVTFFMNIISIVVCVALLIPYVKLKSKKQFPSSIVSHMLSFLIIQHIILLLSSFYDYEFFSVYHVASGNVETYNFNAALCRIQALSLYASNLLSVGLCSLVSLNFYLILGKGIHLKKLRRTANKQLIAIYAWCSLLALIAQSGSTGIYSIYCSLATPLQLRVVFYLPLFIHGALGAGFMMPVVRKIVQQNNKTATSNSTAKKSKTATKKVGGIPKSVVVRMCVMSVFLGLGTAAASIKRIMHSITIESYFETPDAGVVGLTEYLASGIGIIVFSMFAVDPSVTAFYFGKKLTEGTSKRSSREGSSTVAPSSVGADDPSGADGASSGAGGGNGKY